MSKLVKLAKLVTSGAPITDRFMHSILDDSLLPNNIKKKAILYYRGDKRLSVPKFLDALSRAKVKRRVQKGGVPGLGWRIGVGKSEANGYKVTVHDVGEAQEIIWPVIPYDDDKAVFTFGVPQEQQPGVARPKMLSTYIGAGANAAVFNITNEPENVYKLFFKAPSIVFDAIKTNLNKFVKDRRGVATVFPSTYFTVERGQYTAELIANHPPFSDFGYRMIKCQKDLKKALYDSSLLQYIDDAMKKLSDDPERASKRLFVHGDIKLENIMLDDGNSVHISDWDGVYMYDDTLLRGPPPSTFFSPATAHPYYIWYCEMLKNKPNVMTYLDNHRNNTKVMAINITWNHYLKDTYSVTPMIKNIVDGLYFGSFETHARANMSNPKWHEYMLERCDRYSLGMSLLLCAKGADITPPRYPTFTAEKQHELMQKGADIVFAACDNFPGTGQGGRRKLIRGGGADAKKAASTNLLPALSALSLAANPSEKGNSRMAPPAPGSASHGKAGTETPPKPSISSAAGILAIVNQYVIVNNGDVTVSSGKVPIMKSELDELMQTIMIMPDDFELPPPPPPASPA